MFDPDRGTYRRLTDIPIPLDHPAVTAYRGDVYFVGGYSNGTPSARFWRYTPASGRWSELPSMRLAVGAPAAAVIGDRLYVIGGSPIEFARLGARVYGALEIYDFVTRRWQLGPDLPVPRHHHGAVALGGKLYVAGGRGQKDLSLTDVERFDPKVNRWERLPQLPQGLGGTAAVAVDDEVVVIGGGDDFQHWVSPAGLRIQP